MSVFNVRLVFHLLVNVLFQILEYFLNAHFVFGVECTAPVGHLVLCVFFHLKPVVLTHFGLHIKWHAVEYDPEYVRVVDSLVAEAGLLSHLIGITFGFCHQLILHEFVEYVDTVKFYSEFRLSAENVICKMFGAAQFGLDFVAFILC